MNLKTMRHRRVPRLPRHRLRARVTAAALCGSWTVTPRVLSAPVAAETPSVPNASQIAYETAKPWFDALGKRPGEGVRIVQLDTGLTAHPELRDARVRYDLARDFVDGDADVMQDLSTPGRWVSHSHGTETASLVASPPGCADAETRDEAWESSRDVDCVFGVSPGAELVPVRVARMDPGFMTPGNVIKGFEYARAIEADVILIALGGPGPFPALHEAARKARAQGIITLAAAGNMTRTFGIQPCRYDEVTCVAGTDASGFPWALSGRGAWIDVSAPAVQIPYARSERIDGTVRHGVTRGAGTSEATAIVAGAAALWLSLHGKENLVQKYGRDGVPDAFRAALFGKGVIRPVDWPLKLYGAGILNVSGLLSAPLPDPPRARTHTSP